jgi:hypothetical protein
MVGRALWCLMLFLAANGFDSIFGPDDLTALTLARPRLV